jgi:hypothetical protein
VEGQDKDKEGGGEYVRYVVYDGECKDQVRSNTPTFSINSSQSYH